MEKESAIWRVTEMETKFEQLQKDRFEADRLLDIAINFIVKKQLYSEYMKFKETELGAKTQKEET